MTEIRDTCERHVGDDLGIKVRLSEPVDRPDVYSQVGEHVADQNSSRASNVWVWVFAHDMDIDGPAVCVTHLGPDRGEPATEFVDPSAQLLYLSLKNRPLMDDAISDGEAD